MTAPHACPCGEGDRLCVCPGVGRRAGAIKASATRPGCRLSPFTLPLSLCVLRQGFRNKAEVQRFSDMMEEMCHIVATKHR